MNDYDSDNSNEEAKGVSTQEVYDPERNERIRQMVHASSQSNVLEDDQVTDFVLRMAEKNQKMVETAARQHAEQSQFTISDDSEEEGADELDTSYQRKRKHSYKSRSPDEYPPGEAYAGDELADDDQIPSFDPKDDDAISYGRLCCVACALVIAMVATSVLILVFVIIADGEEGKGHHGAYDGMVLPFAPTNLPDICSVSALKTFQGVLDCREPCMKAACCWEKGESGQQPVCWESHPLECAPYESCVNLLSAGSDPRPYPETVNNNNNDNRPTSSVPVAGEGVKACDPDDIDTVDEVILCEDACGKGECCWTTDPKKDQCPTDLNCGGYEPCKVLNHDGSSGGGIQAGIEEAPANLAQVCIDQSSDACAAACNLAPCCWKLATVSYTGPNGESITESVMGSCSHEAECAGYAACKDIPQAINNHSNTSPIPEVTGLEQVCENSLEGACRDTCNSAPCCWQIASSTFTGSQGETVTQAVQGSCSHRDECEQYAPCKKLAAQDVATTAPATVPETTELAAFCAASLNGPCRDSCHRATCCWKLATTTYTGPQGNKITESVMGSCSHLEECAAYEPCKQLSEATSSHTYNIPPAPADLTNWCAMSLDGQCRETCVEASCCWKIATTQYTGPMGASVTEHVRGSCNHRAECVGYEACQKLPEASGEKETAPPLFIPTAPANLDQVCHPAPEAMDSIEACVEYCDAAMCCWRTSTKTYTGPDGNSITESVAGTCSHQPECEAYKACSVLDDDVFSPHNPAVDATPAPDTPAPGTTAPVTAPATSAPGSDTELTEDMIFDVCWNHESQGNGISLCDQACAPGACCWKQDGNRAACPDDFDCAKYEPCAILVDNADATNGQPTELETACSDVGDRSDCIRLCALGTCCFTTDLSKTCDIAAPATRCKDYEPCETIYNTASQNGNNR